MVADEFPVSAQTVPSQTAPTPEEVGKSYDLFGDLYGLILGDSAIHVGMWVPPGARTSTSTLRDLANLAMDRQTDHYIGALGLGPEDHLLDIGCGTGGPAVRLGRASGARASGITVSGSQIALCAQRAREAGLAQRVSFALGDAMDLGAEHADGAYDAAWAIDSFAHMSDQPAAFRGAWRVLRPGGRLLVTEFTRRGEPSAEQLAVWRAVWTSLPPETPATVLEWTEQAGFELEGLENHSRSMGVTGDIMDLLYHDHHERILARYGPEATAEMDAVMPQLREFIRDHVGYHVFLLRKPE
ncbi:cyclopropane-fatty-acyl-phospholipid synthase family protein [Streptomyces sp. TS71-3]|uniref:SAM-dependent methyltransferase n=1 Tax=Streptomyces sp. TS71-3 TaxID=2733862 RepID=UPI001B13D8CD|nr:methyltransferase domain-containing protein [Streptomyces sp. TS71-3]GHJ42632.1 methyltransferase type 11 [Streptomyces sp. TS71-3]